MHVLQSAPRIRAVYDDVISGIVHFFPAIDGSHLMDSAVPTRAKALQLEIARKRTEKGPMEATLAI